MKYLGHFFSTLWVISILSVCISGNIFPAGNSLVGSTTGSGGNYNVRKNQDAPEAISADS